MTIDYTKEGEKQMGTEKGSCKYCGQQKIVQCDPGDTQTEIDEIATANCDCPESMRVVDKTEQIATANARIDELFGDESCDTGFYPIKDDAAINLMKTVASLIADHTVQSAMIQIDGNCKAKISTNSKSKIEVMRTQRIWRKLPE
jgi:transcription elongation factor Elf1